MATPLSTISSFVNKSWLSRHITSLVSNFKLRSMAEESLRRASETRGIWSRQLGLVSLSSTVHWAFTEMAEEQ